MKSIEVELSDVYHIEPEEWSIVKDIYKGKTGKELIAVSRQIKISNERVKKIEERLREIKNASGITYGLQGMARALEENSANYSTKGMTEALKTFSDRIEQIGISTALTKPSEQIKAMESINKKEDDLL